jgi:hypothetical protein
MGCIQHVAAHCSVDHNTSGNTLLLGEGKYLPVALPAFMRIEMCARSGRIRIRLLRCDVFGSFVRCLPATTVQEFTMT